LIAQAAELHVGSVYVWMEEGREAAFAHEARIRSRPVAFQPLDLARELTAMLEAEPHDAVSAIDYAVIKQKLKAIEAESPRLYASFVARIKAEDALAKIEFNQHLNPEEWEKINELLGEPLDQEQYSQKTGTRTPQLPA
jgi:hypothetical protein